jgi:hypothetical protein
MTAEHRMLDSKIAHVPTMKRTIEPHNPEKRPEQRANLRRRY